MSEKLDPIPQAANGDHALVVVRALMGAIPVVGGSAVELFNAMVTPPIERRRRAWMESVSVAIRELYQNDSSILERIIEDEVFHSVLLDATWVAVRNHQSAKLAALRNAVVNAAAGQSFDEDWKLLFVRYVDELTPTHFVVMSFFVDNEAEIAYLDSLMKLADAVNSKCGNEVPSLYLKLICDDLAARGLIRISDKIRGLPGLYSESLLMIEATSSNPKLIVTDFGRGFVAFVLRSGCQSSGGTTA
jgi:hypothetical protein